MRWVHTGKLSVFLIFVNHTLFSPSGDSVVCRLACLPGQHEGSLGAAGAAGEVLRTGDQGHAGKHRRASGEASFHQRN